MLKNFFLNTRKPQGIGGSMMLWSMNWGHAALARWGLRHLEIRSDSQILDVGCGGGVNIARMLKLAPSGSVSGLDYSDISVSKSVKVNRQAITAGRSEIKQGGVSQIPWRDGSFDLVTAFETVYFWPDFVGDLREVRRVLKPGGVIFICNESVKSDDGAVPYQGFVKMLDLKMYSPSDFKAALKEAGFEGAEVRLKGSWGCVLARKNKE
jgi:ubiquinone/menaquinone biosynthesis C-methylase UbiE